MNELLLSRIRSYFIGFATLAIVAQLMWEHSKGGVRFHYYLGRPDEYPAVSNWWGLLVIPVLAWFLSGRVYKRMVVYFRENSAKSHIPLSVILAFLGSAIYGGCLSFSYFNGYDNAAFYLYMGMFALSVVLPIYRAECLLGFVLGMTYMFGPVLPTVVAFQVGAISLVVHFLVRYLYRHFAPAFKRKYAHGS